MATIPTGALVVLTAFFGTTLVAALGLMVLSLRGSKREHSQRAVETIEKVNKGGHLDDCGTIKIERRPAIFPKPKGRQKR